MALAFGQAALVLADDGQFSELKSQYLSLRNTDVNVSRATEWERLARRFQRFVDRNPRSKHAPSALQNGAILNEEMYRALGGEDRLHRSIALLERLARDYPGDPLVDDALIRKGDLHLYEEKDRESARRSYEEVVRAYPKSDVLAVAEARLASINSGSLSAPKLLEGLRPSGETKASGSKRGPVIVLDPGHGGEDFGAVGLSGVLEKDLVLAIAFELERKLTEELGAVVRLTRRGDIFVPLAERTNMANDFEADLFISLHVNASPHGKASGFEVYYLDNAGDQASRKLAERENASMRFEAGGGMNDLQFMLSDLIQSAKMDDSVLLAHSVQDAVVEHLKPRWNKVKDLGVKKAPFYVLVGAHMPCILVEMFFVNNPYDGNNLLQPDFRKEMARGIFNGIKGYLTRSALPEAA